MPPFTVSMAYRILGDAYPEAINPLTRQSIKTANGKAKLRALASVIHSDGDLMEALALIPDDTIRQKIRDGLVPMLTFTPQE